MFQRFRPTFENLESREVFSAGPIAGLSLEAAVEVSGARLDLARAAAFGVNSGSDEGSQEASSLPPIGPAEMPEILPQDLYGDTMSIEEWMDWTSREHDPANGDSIFDFPGGDGRQ